jgi:ABC-2 type transport system ATP-binding protein
MNELAIDLQAVCKSFRSTEVLRGVTLQVEPGRTFAFLGLNAAGKTTLIRMLLGLLKRDDGAIRVLGIDPQREPLELGRGSNHVRLDARGRDRAVCGAVLPDVGT